MTKVGRVLPLLAWAMTGCVMPIEEAGAAQDGLGVTEQALVVARGLPPRALVNPPKADGIPVCFVEGGAQEREWVRDALLSSWQPASVVRFTGFGTCPADFDVGFKIWVRPEPGVVPDAPPSVYRIWVSSLWTSGPCSTSEAAREQCIRAMTIHEAGHGLGFSHEFLRNDPHGPCEQQGTVTELGEFDADSVMLANYTCATVLYPTQLSTNDKLGIALFYGAPQQRVGGSMPFYGSRWWWFDIDGDQRYDAARDTSAIFGAATDIAVSGAWGNGANYIERMGVYKDGEWRLDWNGNMQWDAGDRTFVFGSVFHYPVPGRYRGKSDLLGVFVNGAFAIDWNNNGTWDTGDRQGQFRAANASDIPIVGRWTTDAIERVGIFNNGKFYLDVTGDLVFGAGDVTYTFFPSGAGGKPLVADFANTGRHQIAVYKGRTLWVDWNENGRWDAGSDRTFDIGLDASTMQWTAGHFARHPSQALTEPEYDL